MSFSELFKKAMRFEDEFEHAELEHKDKAKSFIENMKISEDTINRIKSISEKINILGFSELWCPDCQINLPAINYLTHLNENITLRVLNRKGNEEYMEKYKVNGKAKIPTFIVLDEHFNELGTFLEIPSNVRKVENNGNQVEIIVTKREYRKGLYMEQTILDILNIIE